VLLVLDTASTSSRHAPRLTETILRACPHVRFWPPVVRRSTSPVINWRVPPLSLRQLVTRRLMIAIGPRQCSYSRSGPHSVDQDSI